MRSAVTAEPGAIGAAGRARLGRLKRRSGKTRKLSREERNGNAEAREVPAPSPERLGRESSGHGGEQRGLRAGREARARVHDLLKCREALFLRKRERPGERGKGRVAGGRPCAALRPGRRVARVDREHRFDRRDRTDGLLRKSPRGRNGSRKAALEVDGAAAHPREDSRLLEAETGNTHENLRASERVRDDAEDLHVEALHGRAVEHGQAVAFHPRLDSRQRQDVVRERRRPHGVREPRRRGAATRAARTFQRFDLLEDSMLP